MPFHSNPWARQDGYARLPFDPVRVVASDLHAGGITFLDLFTPDRDLPTVAGYLESVPAWLLARPGAVLIRWPDIDGTPVNDALEAFVERLRTRGIDSPLGLVRFPIGEVPTITWSDENQSQRDAYYLQRARRVELASFLHWGGAVWRPHAGITTACPPDVTLERSCDLPTHSSTSAQRALWRHGFTAG